MTTTAYEQALADVKAQAAREVNHTLDRAERTSTDRHAAFCVEAWVPLAQRTLREGHDLAEVAGSIGADGRARVAEIRADRNLSIEAKAAAIEASRAETNAAIEAFRRLHEETIANEIFSLQQALKSPVQGVSPRDRMAADVSARDAFDRAEGAAKGLDRDPRALERLLDRAWQSSDETLARATFATALDRGDMPVIEKWYRRHPEDQARVARLNQLERPTIQQQFSTNLRFVAI